MFVLAFAGGVVVAVAVIYFGGKWLIKRASKDAG
jgi:hypothetical protein